MTGPEFQAFGRNVTYNGHEIAWCQTERECSALVTILEAGAGVSQNADLTQAYEWLAEFVARKTSEPVFSSAAITWSSAAARRFDNAVSDLALEHARRAGRKLVQVADMKEAARVIAESKPTYLE